MLLRRRLRARLHLPGEAPPSGCSSCRCCLLLPAARRAEAARRGRVLAGACSPCRRHGHCPSEPLPPCRSCRRCDPPDRQTDALPLRVGGIFGEQNTRLSLCPGGGCSAKVFMSLYLLAAPLRFPSPRLIPSPHPLLSSRGRGDASTFPQMAVLMPPRPVTTFLPAGRCRGRQAADAPRATITARLLRH